MDSTARQSNPIGEASPAETRAQRLHELALQLGQRLAAMAAAVFFRGAEFGAGAAELGQKKIGVVAETALTGGLQLQHAFPAALADQR